MGMFDRVWVTCPQCGKKLEAQSKSGPSTLSDYTLENAPDDVIVGVIGDTVYCDTCGRGWTIQKAQPRTINVVLE